MIIFMIQNMKELDINITQDKKTVNVNARIKRMKKDKVKKGKR